MTKQEFMAKHDFNDLDFRNLKRYEQVRQNGTMSMFEYLETLIELIASHYDLEGEEFELWLFINHREIYDWLVRR